MRTTASRSTDGPKRRRKTSASVVSFSLHRGTAKISPVRITQIA